MAQPVRSDLRYSADHEWLSAQTPARVGVSAVAADALGEVVFVELPEAGAAVATTMAVAIPSAPSIHTVGGLLAYTGAGLGLVLAMVCLLVIGALALWRSRREETAPAFF